MAEESAADSNEVTNDSIDALLKQAEAAAQGGSSSAPPTESAVASPMDAIPAAAAGVVGAAPGASAGAEAGREPTIEELLQQANFEDAAAHAAAGAPATDGTPAPETQEFKLPSFQQVMADAQVSNIDLLRDVDLNVKIELGRSRMLVEDVLRLSEGSVVELDKLAGDPVDIFVNEKLVARGEVLVLNDNFCVRVNEIVAEVKEEAV